MNKLIGNRIQEIKDLCERSKVEKLWLFGSVATSDHTKNSDVDLLVSFEEMDLVEYAENYFLLAETLEKILGRDVDLVTENSLSNPYFIDSVNESKILIYDRQSQKIFV